MMNDKPIEIGHRKQLFIDDRFFDQQQGIRCVVNPPIKREIGLRPQMPWESGCLGFYSTIIDDDGLIKLWYEGYVGLDVSLTVPRSVCYATSVDGVHWQRQNENLFNWMGHAENNIVMPGTLGVVMIDPVGPADQRYKALGCIFENELWPESRGAHWDITGGGVYLLTSADGIHWRRNPHVASPFFHDSQNNLFYDERIGKYVAYLRTHRNGRTLSRIELDDPTQTPWPYRQVPANVKPNQYGLYLGDDFGAYDVVMSRDELDPADTDVQVCPIVRYRWAEDVYVGLCAMYRHFPDVPGGCPNDGPQDVQLAVSRDGIHWQRPSREPYIALGEPGAWDAGCIWPSLGLVRRGDEVWQYYCATPTTHGQWDTSQLPMGGICRVVQRLDGFISVDADTNGGEFVTPVLVFSGTELTLNLRCDEIGFVRVEILDEQHRVIDGFAESQCVPVQGDHTAAVVRWTSQASVATLSGRVVRLRFVLRACKLYAFGFTQ